MSNLSKTSIGSNLCKTSIGSNHSKTSIVSNHSKTSIVSNLSTLLLCQTFPKLLLCQTSPKFLLCQTSTKLLLCQTSTKLQLCQTSPKLLLCPTSPNPMIHKTVIDNCQFFIVIFVRKQLKSYRIQLNQLIYLQTLVLHWCSCSLHSQTGLKLIVTYVISQIQNLNKKTSQEMFVSMSDI